MMPENYLNSFVFGVFLHLFFQAMLLVGVVLLVIWMVKYLEKEVLMKFVLFFMIAGLLGIFFTLEFNVLDLEDVVESVGNFSAGEMMDLEETI